MTANRRQEKLNRHRPTLIWETLGPLFTPTEESLLGRSSLRGGVRCRVNIRSWVTVLFTETSTSGLLTGSQTNVDVKYLYQIKPLTLLPTADLWISKTKTSFTELNRWQNIVGWASWVIVHLKRAARTKFARTVGMGGMNHWQYWGKQAFDVDEAFSLSPPPGDAGWELMYSSHWADDSRSGARFTSKSAWNNTWFRAAN